MTAVNSPLFHHVTATQLLGMRKVLYPLTKASRGHHEDMVVMSRVKAKLDETFSEGIHSASSSLVVVQQDAKKSIPGFLFRMTKNVRTPSNLALAREIEPPRALQIEHSYGGDAPLIIGLHTLIDQDTVSLLPYILKSAASILSKDLAVLKDPRFNYIDLRAVAADKEPEHVLSLLLGTQKKTPPLK